MDNSRYDIEFSYNDLFISSTGDFVFSLSDQTHIEDTIVANYGWWKDNPLDGVGIRNYLGATMDKQALKQRIRTQLESDGYAVNNPTVNLDNNGNLTINPNATI
jgi:hypothetical protein